VPGFGIIQAEKQVQINKDMKYILYINNAWAAENKDLSRIMAIVRTALVNDWCAVIQIKKRVSLPP
jgi:hypothetical protein